MQWTHLRNQAARLGTAPFGKQTRSERQSYPRLNWVSWNPFTLTLMAKAWAACGIDTEFPLRAGSVRARVTRRVVRAKSLFSRSVFWSSNIDIGDMPASFRVSIYFAHRMSHRRLLRHGENLGTDRCYVNKEVFSRRFNWY